MKAMNDESFCDCMERLIHERLGGLPQRRLSCEQTGGQGEALVYLWGPAGHDEVAWFFPQEKSWEFFDGPLLLFVRENGVITFRAPDDDVIALELQASQPEEVFSALTFMELASQEAFSGADEEFLELRNFVEHACIRLCELEEE
jgi:hypothetical protein